VTEISKLIHLCWYGPDPIPDDYRRNIDRWTLLAAETDWAINVWTEEDKEFMSLRDMMYANGAVPVQVCNVMRLVLLYACGGVYVDCDIIPLRLPHFDLTDRANLFQETGGDKQPVLCSGVIAAPPQNPHVLSMFWWTVQKMVFGCTSKDGHLKAGAGMFRYFPAEWFDGTAIHGPCHWYPISFAQVCAARAMYQYTYADWVLVAEAFLGNEDVYGLHTYDFTWAGDLNSEGASTNESDTTEGESQPCGAAIPDEPPGR
jgi:hypothetical protein